MKILFASDLDNTLIYSYKRIQGDAVAVEEREGKTLSYMTEKAYGLLQEVAEQCVFVPITTRSLEQYDRVRLLEGGGHPPFAIASNGGHLLIEGEIDQAWHQETLRQIAESKGELERAAYLMEQDGRRCFDVRLIDDVFLFTKSCDAIASKRMLERELDKTLATVDTNGEKLYVLPKGLHKGAALERLKKRLAPDYVIAAGDSGFDIPMLQEADLAWLPEDADLDTRKLKREIARYTGTRLQFADAILSSILEKAKGEREMLYE